MYDYLPQYIINIGHKAFFIHCNFGFFGEEKAAYMHFVSQSQKLGCVSVHGYSEKRTITSKD